MHVLETENNINGNILYTNVKGLYLNSYISIDFQCKRNGFCPNVNVDLVELLKLINFLRFIVHVFYSRHSV